TTMRSAGNEPKPVGLPREEKKKGSPWVAISSLVAAAAVAAGVFFGMHSDRAPATVGLSTPVAAVQTVTAVPAAVPPTAPEDRGVDPSSLPAASAGAVAAHGSA